MTHCILIGAPVDSGQQRPGCLMGPAAYRVAGIGRTLQSGFRLLLRSTTEFCSTKGKRMRRALCSHRVTGS